LLFLVLGLVVGAPLVEEFIFRGLLLRGWWVARRGRLWAIPLTSILWTALHVQYDLPVLAYIFLLGIVLGYARILSGNLWIPIAMHAANNALATWEVLRLSP
jgi:membrane protease YdiL (CAAX protease family)